MNKYITSPENLKTIMELLRDKRRNIQYEAFHVFKVCRSNGALSARWRKTWCHVIFEFWEKKNILVCAIDAFLDAVMEN